MKTKTQKTDRVLTYKERERERETRVKVFKGGLLANESLIKGCTGREKKLGTAGSTVAKNTRLAHVSYVYLNKLAEQRQ